MTELRIISGGQTGVDRAALDAALALGVSCGGWCPAGRRAEDGPIADKYALIETVSSDYAERTLANVRASDATLLVCPSESPGQLRAMSAGTHLTAQAVEKLHQPFFIARLDETDPGAACLADICDWIGRHKISVLNIAGPRESECPGIYAAANDLILDLLIVLLGR